MRLRPLFAFGEKQLHCCSQSFSPLKTVPFRNSPKPIHSWPILGFYPFSGLNDSAIRRPIITSSSETEPLITSPDHRRSTSAKCVKWAEGICGGRNFRGPWFEVPTRPNRKVTTPNPARRSSGAPQGCFWRRFGPRRSRKTGESWDRSFERLSWVT